MLPDEYDVLINVTYRGVAVQISDRTTNSITHEQNDLDDIYGAIDYIARVTGTDLSG